MSDETLPTAREVAVQLALIKTVEKRVSAAFTATKAVALKVLDATDRKSAVLDDGTKIGTISVKEGAESTYVSDPAAFLAWVKANRPDEVVTTESVRSSYRAAVIARAKEADGVLFDPETGEQIPGLARSKGDPVVSVLVTDKHLENVAAALADGRLSLAGVIVPEVEA